MENKINQRRITIRHIVDTYRDWQPKFAAYQSWTDKRKRTVQAIKEMCCEALEVLAIDVKTSRKGIAIPREKIVDELGDTLWGLVGVMNECDISWNELITHNMKKLEERNKPTMLVGKQAEPVKK